MRNYYDQQRYEIEQEFMGLGEEETRSGQVCPSCHGGATEEGSLSVTRRGGVLLFNCHRASCSFGGRIGVSSASGNESSKSEGVRRREYIPLSRLDPALVTLLANKFRITGEDIELAGLRWTGEGTSVYARRVCFPIFGPDSRERGKSYRSYQGATPKAIIQFNVDDAIANCWYKWKRTSNILVITEDQMSAIKVAPHHHGLAILGTNLNDSRVDEILAQPKYDRIYLCLDNDAVYEAIKLQLKWRHRLPKMLVLGLQKDIKDMDEAEFTEFLGRLS